MTRENIIQVGSTVNPYEITFVDANGSAVDISTATTKQIIVDPPTGLDLTLTASFTNTGTDGKLKTVISASQTTAGGAGLWKAQGKVSWADGTVLITQIDKFEVAANVF
jgi:hypothetical protein